MAMGQVLKFDAPATNGHEGPERGAGGVEPIWLPNPWRGGARVLMLGCGAKPMMGAVNHDRVKHSPWVNVEGDLDAMPWAWMDRWRAEPFDVCYSYDVVEHLEDVLGFVNEVHALLRPGGIFIMRGGAADNPSSFTDPSHRHWFTDDSMNFVDRSTAEGDHYGRFYSDTLGRPLTEWHIDGIDRVNRHPGYANSPGDIQWTLVRI